MAQARDDATYDLPPKEDECKPDVTESLNWLADITHLSVTEFAYNTDSKTGNQIFYYIIRRADESKSLTVLECNHEGILKALCVESQAEQFRADNCLYYNSVSKVFIANSENGEELKVLGYINKDLMILNECQQPYLKIYKDNEHHAEECFYIQQYNDHCSPATKISSVSTHKCLLIQFAAGTDVYAKAMIACFAKKIFRSYYKLDIQNLVKYNGKTLLKEATGTIDVNYLPLHVTGTDWQKNKTIPLDLCEEDTCLSTSALAYTTEDQFIIKKVGTTLAFKANYYVIRTTCTQKTILLVDTRQTFSLMAHVRNIDTLQIVFHMNHATEEVGSQVTDETGAIGRIMHSSIFDMQNQQTIILKCKKAPEDEYHCVTCAVYTIEAPGSYPLAFVSCNCKQRCLSLTMLPSVDVGRRKLILAFAIKVLHQHCKLHTDKVPDYSSIEELVEKERKQNKDIENLY